MLPDTVTVESLNANRQLKYETGLANAHAALEYLILATPTSPRRNLLTALNMLLDADPAAPDFPAQLAEALGVGLTPSD